MTNLQSQPEQEAQASLHGKVALITGANTGIGLVTARELARRGARLILAGRSAARTAPALEAMQVAGAPQPSFVQLDLSDLHSVRRAAAQVLAEDAPLHLLINNAGIAGARGLTRSGFEMAFGINHVGHFLFTQLLLERLRASAPARVVTVASRAHVRVGGIDFDALRRPTRGLLAIREYQVSKLANVLFSAELGRRLAGTGVTTYSLHPGVVSTDIWRNVPRPLRSVVKLRKMLSAEQGARTTLYCATAPEVREQTGLYYQDGHVKEPSLTAQNAQLAAQLWERSLAWTA